MKMLVLDEPILDTPNVKWLQFVAGAGCAGCWQAPDQDAGA
jgi:hypothetical protein